VYAYQVDKQLNNIQMYFINNIIISYHIIFRFNFIFLNFKVAVLALTMIGNKISQCQTESNRGYEGIKHSLQSVRFEVFTAVFWKTAIHIINSGYLEDHDPYN
jgi:hypothetical protein